MTGVPDHWSYSQWNEFRECGHRYRLRRVLGHTGHPAVASVAGQAFHAWTQDHDLYGFPIRSWEECLEETVAKHEGDHGVPRDEWRVSGRRTPTRPDGETLEVWTDQLGPDLCDRYITWTADTEWVIARDLPKDVDGVTVGIEYHVEATLAGEKFPAFFDRISRWKGGELGVVDIKTGTRVRHSIQLGMYAAAARQHGLDLKWAALYDARKGRSTDPVPLDGWDDKRVTEIMAPQIFLRDNGIFPITPGEHCDWCPVRRHCEYHM